MSSSIAKRLGGKVAIITGGASGIGASTVRLFLKQGAKVIVADIQDELGHALCKDLNSDDVTYAHCDVSIEDDVRNTIKDVVARHGKLDVMFNNAAIPGDYRPGVLDADWENFEKVMSVNLIGAFLGAKHAARAMVPARKGSILFTSSVASVIAGHIPHAYTCSKYAVVGLTKNLAVDLGRYGIRVNCISPYGVATTMLKNGMEMEEDETEQLVSRAANLKGVVVKAEDMANAALYLASDESRYVSGLNLVVDGGFSTVNPSFDKILAQEKGLSLE
uniref:Secoisolariciresinol dehydrogenase 15 n=1 Tax=Kadsura heteroclita TaxID=124781 RepID=A0A7U3W0P7_9MAGN|nr:secoisolariciresinol dehydrogenase 15 [Kadsura heteroclita]